MGTRKKGSELVFNLQWRNKPDNGGDKSNVIGMYDTPKTTSNFEMFKSYLLKNSGVAGNDVKVTYITDDGQEWIIDSQKWFEIALSAFRSKARFGEVIYLKLDKISDRKQQVTRKLSNDVETQSDVDSMGNNVMTPPEWFINYMTQFKRDIIQEVTASVSANTKEKEGGVPVVNSKKMKPESSKRSKKHIVHGEIQNDKDLLKTIKFDRKLESKLDKLDAKTKKIKEKKQALINKMENDDRFSKVSVIPTEENACASSFTVATKELVQDNLGENSPPSEIPVGTNGTLLLNGRSQKSKNCERMMGGEIYLHTWEIINTGSITWPSNTELRLTWGSADLVPSEKCLSCPALMPGLKGRIYVRFQIPTKPGTYETYWNFFSGSIRFGQALSCCIIVEEPLRTIPMNLNYSKHNITTDFVKSPESIETENETNVQSSLIDSEKYLRYLIKIGEEIKSRQKLATTNQQLNDETFTCFPGFNSENSLTIDSTKMTKLPAEITEKILNGKSMEDQTSQNSFQLIYFPTKTEEKPEKDNLKQVSSESIFNLSQKMDDIKLEDAKPLIDSDSDWESVWSYGKNKQLEDFLDGYEKRSSNAYGIQEKDLIVDLSVNPKESVKVENTSVVTEEKENTNVNQDNNNNNNNNEGLDNNNSTEVISEIASVASSDVSSGYDVLQVPICEEKEDDGSGYVYITIDGNKLSVPKHILRPDFVATAEEAPGPDIVVPEKPTSPKPDTSETTKPEEDTESKPEIQEQNIQDNLSCMTHCSAMGSCYSDAATGRLFIFPQNHPGYEVFCNNSACTSITREEPIEPAQTYSWSKSSTQYSFADLQNPNSTQLKNDPYGPLEQSRTTPCNDRHSTPVPEASVEQPAYQNVSSPPSHSGCPYATYNQTSKPYICPQYQHVPNYQQSTPKPTEGASKPEASAPPDHSRSPDHSNQGVPVHLLPENLVSGAVNVASSAINTARSVINMIVPSKSEPGRWVNGHWVTENPESRRAKNLVILAEMGFWDPDLNATLLARYNDDVNKVINELIQ